MSQPLGGRDSPPAGQPLPPGAPACTGGRYAGRRQVAPELVPVLGEVQHVRVPRDLPDLPAGELTAWVLLVWRAGRAGSTDVSQARLQEDFGRGGSDPARLRQYLRGLEQYPLIETVHTRRGDRTRNAYRPLRLVSEANAGRRWVELPKRLLVALAAGDAGPEHVLAARRWLTLCAERGSGWRREHLAALAAAWGQSVRTVRRHRSVLAALGVVEVLDVPGQRSVTALPGMLPVDAAGDDLAASADAGPGVIHSSVHTGQGGDAPRTQITGHPGHRSPVTPDTDHRGTTWGGTTCTELPPSSVSVDTAEVADARAPVDAARAPHPAHPDPEPGHERTDGPSPLAWVVIASLPRAWREGCPGWVRRRMAERVDRAMSAYRSTRPDGSTFQRRGLGPGAIVAAVARYATPAAVVSGQADRMTDGEFDRLVDAAERGRAHTRALSHVLATLAGDVAAGACASCGHHHDDQAADCRCCTSTTSAAATTARAGGLAAELVAVGEGRCVLCEHDDLTAVIRNELPLPMVVCDGCWSHAADELAEPA